MNLSELIDGITKSNQFASGGLLLMGVGAIGVNCSCGPGYICKQCGSCLVHTHQQAHRVWLDGVHTHSFLAESAEGTFVNEGWNKDAPYTEEWIWYRRVPGGLSADCWWTLRVA